MNAGLPPGRSSSCQAEPVPPATPTEPSPRPTLWVEAQFFDCCPEAVALISAKTRCVLTVNSTFEARVAPLSSIIDSHVLDVLFDGVDGLRMEQALQTILSDGLEEDVSCVVAGCEVVANGVVLRPASYDWAVKRQGEVVILSGREVPPASSTPIRSVVVPHWLGAPIGGPCAAAETELRDGAPSFVDGTPDSNPTSQPKSWERSSETEPLMDSCCNRDFAAQQMEEMRQFAELKAYGELLRQMEVLMQKIFHEIRTPCHALQMITKTVLEAVPGNDEIKTQLEAAWAQSVHICQLADDVKCVISLQSGQLPRPKPSWFHLRTLLTEKQKFIESLFTRSLELKICCDSVPEDLWVHADPSLLSVVLRQLLTNAVRYTQAGAVTLEVCRESDGAERIVFCVTNEGPAVPPTLLQDIQHSWLDRLCARILSDTSDGFGLGLPIASTYVQAMGGQLQVSSHASVNKFSFAITAATRSAPAEGTSMDTRPCIPPSASLFSLVPGTRFSFAVSNSSLALASTSIVPSQSGASDAVDKPSPTPKESVGRSASAPLEGHVRGKKSKCGRFQWKCLIPWSRSAQQLASERRPDAPSASPSDYSLPATTPVARPPRVLVVEDNVVCQKVVCRCLERHGMPHALADNGQVACDLVAADPTGFDVVLMDIRMPVMDGVTATRVLRRDLGARMPIIVFSAELREQTWAEASHAGATDLLPKPATPQMVVEMIRKHSHGARP